MTTYQPVPEPAGPLWTRDEDGTVRRWVRDEGGWSDERGNSWHWPELLELRPSDHHPDLPEGVTFPLEVRLVRDEWTLTDRGGNNALRKEAVQLLVERAVRREVERIEHGEPDGTSDATDAIERMGSRVAALLTERDRLVGFVRQLVDAGSTVVKTYADSPVTSLLTLGFLREPVGDLRAVIERVTGETGRAGLDALARVHGEETRA